MCVLTNKKIKLSCANQSQIHEAINIVQKQRQQNEIEQMTKLE